MTLQTRMLAMLWATIAVQTLDAGLHIAINEVEMLRILSNAVLVIGVSLGVFLSQSWRAAIRAGAGAYVALNLVFVALYGLENPVSGVNRTPLFGFMALSLWLTYRVARLRQSASPSSKGRH